MEKLSQSQTEDKIVYNLKAKECFTEGEPVFIKFILENRSDNSLFFLKWHTPFEGFNSDMFRITHNGQEINYEGRMVKRGKQEFEDYLLIKPKSLIDTVIELSSVYNMQRIGDYQIEFNNNFFDLISAPNAIAAKKMFQQRSDELKLIVIEGNSLDLKVYSK